MAIDPTVVDRLAELLREAGRAHHEAYRHTNGEDPEWPLWYAGYLRERAAGVFPAVPTKSELTYLLVAAERAMAASPGADWPSFYARFVLEQRGGASP
jgi:hypothetical protein